MSVPNTNLIQVLPNEELTKLEADVQPTAVMIRTIQRQIYANARSVPSSLGGGNLGHLGLVFEAADYLNLQPPEHPGVPEVPAVVGPPAVARIPAIPAVVRHAFVMPAMPVVPDYSGKTGPQVANAKADYVTALQVYNTAHSLEKQLKNQIIKAVPRLFIGELEHPAHGYALVTTRELLTHLMSNYGKLNADDLQDNLNQLGKPWDLDMPIETVFNNVAECRLLAQEGGDPITEQTAVRTILQTFQNSNLFEHAVREWRNKPEADKTINNIRIHFKEANRQRLKDNPTKRSEKAFATKEKAGTSSNGTPVTEQAVNTTQGRYYCWTHGGTYNKNHTSKTCTKKAEGHNCEATFENMLGGNNTLQRKRGETAIWKPKPRAPRPSTPAPGQGQE
jgi:hypothetical protein